MKRTIVLINLLVALALAGLVTARAVSDRGLAMETAFQNAGTLAKALAGHTGQTLAGIDSALLSAIDTIDQERASGVRTAELHRFLERKQRGFAATLAFYVIDRDGKLVAVSGPALPPQVIDRLDLSGLKEFRKHRDDPADGLLLADPRIGTVGKVKGQWIATVTRRLNAPDGSFDGIVGAILSLDHLLRFYDTLRTGRESIVGLINSSGTVVVRAPFDTRAIGQDVTDGALVKAFAAGQISGRIEGAVSADGIERVYSWQSVGNTSIHVYVGLSKAEILALWRGRLAFQVAMAAFAMLLFAAVSIVTGLSIQRRQEQSGRIKQIADESAALLRTPTRAELLDRVSAIARRLTAANDVRTRLARREDGATAEASGGEAKTPSTLDATLEALVTGRNRAMLVTQAELQRHPAWKAAAERGRKAPRGWLGVPIVSQDGSNLGIIRLSDKPDGEFSQDDLNELTQIANVTGAALENLQSIETRDTALAAMQAAKAEIETIFTSISDAVVVLDPDWQVVYLNAEAERIFARPRAELIGKSIWQEFPDDGQTPLRQQFERALRDNAPALIDIHDARGRGWFSIRAFPHAGGLTLYVQDITRRVESEERLRQANKMDAIGQLTGGIAHDFNNLLTVIIGNADALADPAAAGDVAARVDVIRRAAERGAELTHRLLAFARRQPLDPRTTNINDLVAEFDGMLRRTIGATVDIELVRGSGLWHAIVDPSELQSALLNLAINARDAMPDGGRLTIETANMAIDAAYAGEHNVRPGQYVMLAVSDTGVGMSPDTIEKAFDPFFTTKEKGKGSGLGLSMVYGFMRQTGGHVRIYSEPGHGSTVRLYLPRSQDDFIFERPRAPAAPLPRGVEHILVVEDDDLVRRHTVNSLRSLGYAVTECENGADALRLLDHGAAFDLILTDVVLPGPMSGKDVAVEARKRSSGIRILFMSGYSENAIVHHGRLDRGVNLLAKPFRLADLARKVREALAA